jgi:hypothetical protein
VSQCTEVEFTRFLSAEFTKLGIEKPPDKNEKAHLCAVCEFTKMTHRFKDPIFVIAK